MSSLAGSQIALVVQGRPETLVQELAARARVSRILRRGVTPAELVVVIPPDLAGTVPAAIKSHAGGARFWVLTISHTLPQDGTSGGLTHNDGPNRP